MRHAISRREALKISAGAAILGVSGANLSPLILEAADGSIPKRVLGKTGLQISQLTFGCGSRFFNGYPDDQKALEVLELAFSHGVNYFDTAHGYGEGESERRLGLFIKGRRDKLFVATKLEARDSEGFMRQFDLSLKRLQTQQVDILHIHGIENDADLGKIFQKDGILKRLTQIKEQKAARFIGFSCHTDGAVARKAIDQFDFDCCMLQLNAGKIGGFEELALPAARKKNMGILAMKATAQEKLLGDGPGKSKIDALLQYAWSLPIAAVNLGMPTLEMVRQNLALAKNFKPMEKAEMEQLQMALVSSRPDLDRFFRNHSDFLPA
jgi:predicted aldo/keto reductase-like oxidoreductase